MKYINKIGMMTMAAGMLAVASCTDFTDYNSVPEGAGQSGKTIWENLSSDPQLSDFVQAVEKAGYADELKKSHYYTVWAPVNGSFNKDSLMALSSERILKGFVKNHIAEFNHAETDNNDSIIFTLNEKLYRFTNNGGLKFGDMPVIANSEIAAYNHPCSNGLYYKLQSPAIFRPNGYQAIEDMTDVASKYSEYIKRFERLTLDESKSQKGAIINNEQTYDDSVMVLSNSFLHNRVLRNGEFVDQPGRIGRAYIDVEDSSYTVLIPSDAAWNDAYDSYSSLYNYITPMKYMDLDLAGTNKGTVLKAGTADNEKALQLPDGVVAEDVAAYWKDSLACERIVRNTVFNNSNRYNFKLNPDNAEYRNLRGATLDTLNATNGSILTGVYDVYAKDPIKLSNGWAYVRDNVKLTNWFEINGVNKGRVLAGKSNDGWVSYPKNRLPLDIQAQLDSTQMNLRYYRVEPSGTTSVPELDVYTGSPLSTTYRMFVVMVPNWIEEYITAEKQEDKDSLRQVLSLPYSLRFDFSYTDENNNIVNIQKMGQDSYVTDPAKIDTLDLGSITFPVCYSGTGISPNLRIMHTVSTFTTANRKKYAQTLRVAAVILYSEDYYKHLHPEAYKEGE